jgi:hypothetical protein
MSEYTVQSTYTPYLNPGATKVRGCVFIDTKKLNDASSIKLAAKEAKQQGFQYIKLEGQNYLNRFGTNSDNFIFSDSQKGYWFQPDFKSVETILNQK